MLKSSLMRGSAIASLIVAGGLCGAVANAQEAEATGEREVIVVTATRREESVQDIPINIAAVGAEQLEEQGSEELAELLAYVPGINVVDRGGRQGNPIIVRGLNADPIGSGDGNNNGGGTVSTYLGDIPVYIDLKLNDLERVEVLLGPQGTLYGAGTLGGAIRYIPKKPDTMADSFSVRAGAFQYSEAESISTEAGFTFNKALGDTFALRGSLDWEDDSGFIDYPYVVQEIGVSNPDPDFSDAADVGANLMRIEDADSEETLSGRIAARWLPAEWLDGTLTYYYQNAQIGGRRGSGYRSTVPVERYELGKRVPEPNEITNELLALEVTADLGFAELTSASGASKFEDDGQRDQTDLLITLEYSYETFPTFTAFTDEKGKEDRFNQELRLVSTHGGPFSWIVGGFYNKLETAGYSAEYTPGYAAFAGFDRPDDLEYFSQSRIDTVERAIFGELSYALTDRLTITVGGRAYDYELKEFSAVDFPLFDPDFVAPTVSEIADMPFDTTLGQEDDGFLSKINISYDATEDVLLYATVSEGYRIGNSNGVGQCDDFDPAAPVQQGACALAPGQEYFPGGPDNISNRDERQYGPDTTTNYEVGFKSAWMGGDLILNGAAYYIEWTDPQVSSATVNASIPITVNADGAESKGLELSADWRASDNFSIRGNFSRVDSELTAPVPSLVRTISPPGFGTAFEDGLAGDRLPGSPELQGSLFATYKVFLSNADLAFNLGATYQSDVLTRAGGRGSSLTLDSFTLLNGSIVYDAGPWKGTLFVNNILDEFYETGAVGTPLYNQTVMGANVRTFYTQVGAPRTIGVRFSWDVF